MAKLTTEQRNDLPTSTFALPGRRYPINDPNHARNALARVSQHGTPEEKSEVRAAVHRKYPDIGSNAAASFHRQNREAGRGGKKGFGGPPA